MPDDPGVWPLNSLDSALNPTPTQGSSGSAQRDGRPAPPAGVASAAGDGGQLELLARFIVGALVLGGEELTKRARRWEDRAPTEVGPLAGGQPREEAGYGDLARYLVIGMAGYGYRTAARLARGALSTSGGVAAPVVRGVDRLTGSFLLRPFRRPLSGVVGWAKGMSRDWIDEGWREEQISRWIAANAIPEIVDDVIHIISQNPELAELVRNQISQQSLGMASSVVDTSRKLSGIGDDVTENIVRRLLLRGRRAEIDKVLPMEDLPPTTRRSSVHDGNQSG